MLFSNCFVTIFNHSLYLFSAGVEKCLAYANIVSFILKYLSNSVFLFEFHSFFTIFAINCENTLHSL